MDFPSPIEASPAVAANNEIYFSAPYRNLISVTQDSRPAWLVNTDGRPVGGNIIAPPVIGRNGTIYVGNDMYLCAINDPTNHLAPPAASSWPMFRGNPRHTGRVETEKNN